MRTQQHGQTIDAYVTALHTLSEHCEYENLRERLVRARIVLGVQDGKLREKLMMIQWLTLIKAVEIARHWETVKRQQGGLQGDGKAKSVEAVTKGGSSSSSKNQNWTRKKASTATEETGSCRYCAKQHKPKQCPAWGKQCGKCNK